MDEINRIVVVISADVEWEAVVDILKPKSVRTATMGSWFLEEMKVAGEKRTLIFFHGGWGKILAAASTQYVIDRWKPGLVVNLGTCGGFEGEIERGTILLVDRTIVYDICEQIGDYDDHIAFYTTDIDLSWISKPYPGEVKKSLIVSGDKDLISEEIPDLIEKYGAVAGDWESGAIAFVAVRNGVQCLILRGVTDLVGDSGGEAYGNVALFRTATQKVMRELLQYLPAWVENWMKHYS